MRTYERGRELRESIRSVLNQSFKDFELIVINNGGCDELKGVVDSFGSARIKYHKLDRKRELGGALNEGILRSEGKYVAYLDDDDVYYPNHLETVMRFVEKHPNTDFVYSNAWWCYGAVEGERFLEKSRAVLDWRPKKFDRDLLFYINYISTLNALHRRDCLRTTGLFNEDLAVFEDWDLWMRLACNYTFFQLNELTGEYRIKRNNTTQVDQLNMAFLGNVMGPYYEFDSANAVFVMNYLRRGQRKKAQELYESMVSNYSHCTLKAKKNLFYLSKHFPYWRSKRLFGRLAVDYLKAKVKHYAARGWRRNTGDNTTAI
jgi:glycosyltransferase involved in cell wall biosynthesis